MSQSAMEVITQKLQDHSLEIEDAIESGEVPDKLLHQLACDCIDRALNRLKNIGKNPEEPSWKALDAKRDWLNGDVDDEALKAAHEEVMTTDATTAWGVVRSHARNSARNCIRSVVGTATEAVLWSERKEANAAERQWITKRFTYLCQVWESCGERSPGLLKDESCPIECPEDAALHYNLD